MNEFRTIVRVTPANEKIALNHRILTLGSCFSDAIGTRLNRNKFLTSINPFGVIYNPVSLHRVLNYSLTEKPIPPDNYLKHGDIYLHYDLHSSFSSLQKSELEDKINDSVSGTHKFIRKCKWLLITYGTAWVYTRKESGEIVANCHKQPSNLFEKSLLTSDQIINSFEKMYNDLNAINPNIRIILTLSPVRHLKDTLELNSVSKSIVRTACHLLAEKFFNVEYFPAYEIMMDDLRDYRFYKSDMLHPTEQAEDYIWETFIRKYMDADSIDFIQQWKTIYPSLQHRPFHPESSGHQIFLRQTLHKLEELKSIVNVDAEIKSVQAQLLDSKNTNKTAS